MVFALELADQGVLVLALHQCIAILQCFASRCWQPVLELLHQVRTVNVRTRHSNFSGTRIRRGEMLPRLRDGCRRRRSFAESSKRAGIGTRGFHVIFVIFSRCCAMLVSSCRDALCIGFPASRLVVLE